MFLYNNCAATFRVTILFFCRELYELSLNQGVFYCTKIARLPFGWQSYSLYRNICLVLAKACFSIQKWRLHFGLQSYSFVEKFMLSVGQGVFYCTKIMELPFEWQSYSFVERYMLSLSQFVLYYTKTAHLPFRWQSYSFVEKHVHILGQGVF